MSSIFSLGSHRQQLSRNAFDLSRKALLTAPSGALLPVFTQEVQPNDHVTIKTSNFTRTAPLNSAAYVDVREQVDYFFVPYRLLWSFWPHFISRTNDYNSELLTSHSNLVAGRAAKVGNRSGSVPTSIPMLKGEDIYYLYYAKNIVDPNNRINEPNPSFIGDKGDLFGIKKKYNAVRLLNLLGYGYDGLGNEFRTATPPGGTHTTTAKDREEFEKKRQEQKDGRSFDKVHSGKEQSEDLIKSQSYNPFRLLAYQKIFNDYYRRDDYLGSDVSSFNIDAALGGSISRESVSNIIEMRYLPLKRDYFTNVYPSNIYFGGITDSDHFSHGVDETKLNQINNFLGITPTVSQEVKNHGGYSVGVNLDEIKNRYNSVLSTASLRNAYAIEKLLTLMNVAGKNYRDQMETRWGIKTHTDTPDHALYIGSHNSKIQINEVVATSDSENTVSRSSLGEIVGRGLGAAQGDTISFDAKEHGIIMGIYSCYSQTLYNSHGVDRFNFKFGFADYYQPEFDNLGMQPLVSSEIFNDDPNGDRSYIGWQPRYSEYKTALDKVYGAFQSRGTKSFWTAPLLVQNFQKDDKTYRSVNIRDLSVNPHTLESVFAINYDGTTDTDMFLVDLSFDVKKVSSMSVLGEPLIN